MKFEADKFKHFDDCYGKNFDQEANKYLPSKTQKFKEHGLPFSPTQQALKCKNKLFNVGDVSMAAIKRSRMKKNRLL